MAKLTRMIIKKKLPEKYHSPAGRRYLKRKKKKKETEPVYFKTVKTKSKIQQLKDAGLSDKDLRALGYKG